MKEPYERPDRAEIAARVHAELAAERALAAAVEPAPLPEPEPELPAEPEPEQAPVRCRRCGYLTTTLGHYWACHE